MRLRRGERGIYHIFFHAAPGVERQISTGTTDYATASRIAKESGISEIEAVTAKAAAVNQSAVLEVTEASTVSVSTAADLFLSFRMKTGQAEPATNQGDKYILEAWIRDSQIANVLLPHVKAEEIHAYVNDPRKCWKRTTRIVILSTLRKFFRYCVDEGLTNRNPAGSLRVSMKTLSHEQKESKEVQTFTPEDIDALLKVAPPLWKLFILIAYHTGLRLGDIARLEWASVANDHSFLRVWTDKRDKRVQVPLPPVVSKMLDDLDASQVAAPFNAATDEFLFPNQRVIADDPKRRAWFSVTFARLCKKAGVKGKHFHGLRHTFITLASENKSVEDIATLVGHSGTETTKGYIHDTIKSNS